MSPTMSPTLSRSVARAVAVPDARARAILAPLQRTTWRYWTVFALAALGAAWGLYAYSVQWREGLSATGLNRPVYWGFYMANFVFFIAISFGGTLVSAVLRVMGAGWRHPITRAAEGLTIAALCVGAPQVIMDMGRPDRLLAVLQHGRFQSPILWDIIAINLYFLLSVLYLYLPLIPDLAYCRDHLPSSQPLRKRVYGLLSLGWKGEPAQLERLHRFMGIMAVALIPVAVLVHSVLAWVFSVTVQPMWHSTIFGPYFVVGAIFSGTGAVLVLLGILRRSFGLQQILTKDHFRRLGRALLVMTLVWSYFTLAEGLSGYFAQEPLEMAVLNSKLTGAFAVPFWSMIGLCLVLPLVLLISMPPIAGAVLAGISVNIGMWLERVLIVVPTLTHPRMNLGTNPVYHPSWVEWSIFGGSLCAMVLLYAIFTKLFPIVSIWEREPEHVEGPVTEPRWTALAPTAGGGASDKQLLPARN